MEAINLLGSTLGLGFLSGLNLYATVLTVGVGIQLGFKLPSGLEPLEVLANPWILAVAGIIFVLEFVADKIPWVDSIWDAIHTFIRPLGAAGLGAAAVGLGSFQPEMVVIAVLCAGTALASHSTKAGTRLLANHSPEPFSNIVISLVEDFIAIVGTWLALMNPEVALFFVIIFLLMFCWFAPKIFRLIRVEMLAALAGTKMLYYLLKQFLTGLFGSRQFAGTDNIAGAPISYLTDEPQTIVRPRLSENLPEKYSYYLNDKPFFDERPDHIRCIAGKGIKKLKNSVGYLFLCDGKLVFVSRKWFRFREYEVAHYEIEDIHFKKRLLLDRLTLRVNGKKTQLFFFKDFEKRNDAAFEILKYRKEGSRQ